MLDALIRRMTALVNMKYAGSHTFSISIDGKLKSIVTPVVARKLSISEEYITDIKTSAELLPGKKIKAITNPLSPRKTPSTSAGIILEDDSDNEEPEILEKATTQKKSRKIEKEEGRNVEKRKKKNNHQEQKANKNKERKGKDDKKQDEEMRLTEEEQKRREEQEQEEIRRNEEEHKKQETQKQEEENRREEEEQKKLEKQKQEQEEEHKKQERQKQEERNRRSEEEQKKQDEEVRLKQAEQKRKEKHKQDEDEEIRLKEEEQRKQDKEEKLREEKRIQEEKHNEESKRKELEASEDRGIDCTILNDNITASERARTLLRKGGMPFFPAGRREWNQEEVIPPITIPAVVSWPPKNWKKMTPEQKYFNWEYASITLELNSGKQLRISKEELLLRYHFLALPSTNTPTGSEEITMATKSQFYLYQALAYNIKSDKEDASTVQTLEMLETAVNERDNSKDDVIKRIDDLDMPLRLGEDN